MAKKEKAATQVEPDATEATGPTSPPGPSPTGETRELHLSPAQRHTVLRYAELPAHVSERLAAQGTAADRTRFTLDELDELLDHVQGSVYRAKGNERQKVQRIVAKVSNLLGSTIEPGDLPARRLPKNADTVYQIKMTLRAIDPPIWRCLQTQDCILEELHALIQVTMGWEFGHLYRFNVGGVDYADRHMVRDEDAGDARTTRLSAVLPPRNRRPRFAYEYDFGDEWIHRLIVEERFPAEAGVKYPRCLAGERACPPEDCGGPWSYADFVEALRDPGHRRHEELLEWVGGAFDPEAFDLEAVNHELRHMRTRKT